MDAQTDAMSQLKKMVIGQKSVGLPDIDPRHPLWHLHQQLIEYDQFVSEVVIRVLSGEKSYQPYPEDERLQQAFADLEARLDNTAMLAPYQRYQQRLSQMLSLAAQVVAEIH